MYSLSRMIRSLVLDSIFTLSGYYLAEVQARRGVTDFLVVCDETNNTPEVIDRNEFVAELFLKPTRSINYVTVTVTATKNWRLVQ